MLRLTPKITKRVLRSRGLGWRHTFYPPANEGDNDPCFLYVVRAEQFYKIGISKTPIIRLETLRASNPFRLDLVLLVPLISFYARRYEAHVHSLLDEHRKNGEWFRSDLTTIRRAIVHVRPMAWRWIKGEHRAVWESRVGQHDAGAVYAAPDSRHAIKGALKGIWHARQCKSP